MVEICKNTNLPASDRCRRLEQLSGLCVARSNFFLVNKCCFVYFFFCIHLFNCFRDLLLLRTILKRPTTTSLFKDNHLIQVEPYCNLIIDNIVCYLWTLLNL